MTASAAPILIKEKNEKAKRTISIETYSRIYAQKEDSYRYEWNNGNIEKTARLSMNRSQLKIVSNLSRLFMHTQAFKKMGELEREVIMFLPKSNRNRVADLAYLTKEQISEQNDLYPSISTFVIEIISKNDKASDVQEKLEQYFVNGVQVVWQIFPNQKTVHVYTSPVDIKICKGSTICSASPALDDFNVSGNDIFS
jgi:Uma2 family endonuclease